MIRAAATSPRATVLPAERRRLCLDAAARDRGASRSRSGLTPTFYAAILVVVAFLVLGRSAAYVGFPPLYGGELALAVLAVLFVRLRTVKSFLREPVGLLVAAYLLVSLPRLPFAYAEAGIECFVYAVVAYYAAFVYFGFAVVSTPARQRRFVRVLYYALLLAVFHVILAKHLPLEEMGPEINGVPLLGNTDGAGVYTTVGLAYALVFARTLGPVRTLVLAAAALASQLFVGARGTLLSIAASVVVLVWYWKVWVPRAKRYLPHLAFGLCFLVCVLGLVCPKLSVQDAIAHQGDLVVAIFGDSPNLPQKAGSKFHRRLMWGQIVNETSEETPWFGQGFRGQLVSASFRNPHNSFLNIYGRVGVVGLSLAVCIYVGLPLAMARRMRQVRDPELRSHMLFYLCFSACFLGIALTGPVLASPYTALVCNFLFGASLACYALARRTDRGAAR